MVSPVPRRMFRIDITSRSLYGCFFCATQRQPELRSKAAKRAAGGREAGEEGGPGTRRSCGTCYPPRCAPRARPAARSSRAALVAPGPAAGASVGGRASGGPAGSAGAAAWQALDGVSSRPGGAVRWSLGALAPVAGPSPVTQQLPAPARPTRVVASNNDVVAAALHVERTQKQCAYCS